METTALAKLIMLGKLTKVVKIGDVEFELETTPITNPPKADDPKDMICTSLALAVRRIDKDDYSKPESKESLKSVLAQLQGVVLAKLLEVNLELIQQQRETVDGITSKKE